MSITSKNSSVSGGGMISKSFSLLMRPITKLHEGLFVDTEQDGLHSAAEEQKTLERSLDDGSDPMTLEGTLYYRKGGRGKKVFAWKRLYVVLDMADGGSVSCFNINSKDDNMLRKMYTSLNRGIGNGSDDEDGGPSRHEDECLYFPADVHWLVKDVQNDPKCFAIEIPTTEDANEYHQEYEEEEEEASVISTTSSSIAGQEMADFLEPLVEEPLADESRPTAEETSVMGETALESQLADTLLDEINDARNRSKKRLRFYFKCTRTRNEKALWLRAFSKCDRMSDIPSRKGKVYGAIARTLAGNVRIRNEISAAFASETRQLERMFGTQMLSPTDQLSPGQSPGGKEFRVVPTYAYPHRWMTAAELDEEMILPSSHFHDLRIPSKRGQEIGTLRIEVLQCLGLPKLDRASETDAVVYLVCGAYAFATDVIMDCASPMWLRKARRACIFPIFHGYARLFAGVFDHDGPGSKDDFAGRVVLDLSRLRPGSTYDVTLPLRMSAHVYSRRKRGSIRLRFTLDWKSERAALLSYIPKKITTPRKARPSEDVTIMCTDETSFRNVAITVHGAHLPGRFSPKQFKALLREVNFTRKMVIMTLRKTIRNTIMWKNPAISLFVFVGWMHCVYKNQFSLAPVYVVSFLLIHMIRNYAKYGMDGPMQLGFVPLSYEEMFYALMAGGDGDANCFETLEFQKVGSRRSVLSEGDVLFSEDGEYVIKTHKPMGKRALRALGFLEAEETMTVSKGMEEQLEFPFSNGMEGVFYPKYTVEESLVLRPSKKAKEKSKGLGSRLNRSRHSRIPSSVVAPMDVDIANGLMFEDDMLVEQVMRRRDNYDEEQERGIPRTGSGDIMEEVYDTLESNGYIAKSFSNDESEAVISASDSGLPPTKFTAPQQDIDRLGAKNDKSLVEDLAEAKYKMHELTWHLFNDQSYAIKSQDPVYFGQARKTSQGRGSEYVSQQLDKLLGLGEYSNGNLIVSKVAPYVEPIVGSVGGFLCLFRALFNVLTWRDPYLSFWVSILLGVLVVVLLIFPWRIFLFIVGVLVVGPQNFIYRLVKERKDAVQQIVADSKAPGGNDFSSNDSVGRESDKDAKVAEETDLLENHQVFTSHAEPNTRLKPVDKRDLDPRELHHVVVPYSQLKYQRMYDWPPEPQHARVKIRQPDPPSTTSQHKRRSYVGFASEPTLGAESSAPLRRSRTYSGHRRAASTAVDGPSSRSPVAFPKEKKKNQ